MRLFSLYAILLVGQTNMVVSAIDSGLRGPGDRDLQISTETSFPTVSPTADPTGFPTDSPTPDFPSISPTTSPTVDPVSIVCPLFDDDSLIDSLVQGISSGTHSLGYEPHDSIVEVYGVGAERYTFYCGQFISPESDELPQQYCFWSKNGSIQEEVTSVANFLGQPSNPEIISCKSAIADAQARLLDAANGNAGSLRCPCFGGGRLNSWIGLYNRGLATIRNHHNCMSSPFVEFQYTNGITYKFASTFGYLPVVGARTCTYAVNGHANTHFDFRSEPAVVSCPVELLNALGVLL